jgi:hypothetical protein
LHKRFFEDECANDFGCNDSITYCSEFDNDIYECKEFIKDFTYFLFSFKVPATPNSP